jgi:hypothetical protein
MSGGCNARQAFNDRLLKQSASGVLASLRSSTYRSVRLASSLVAALLDGLFEHPAKSSPLHFSLDSLAMGLDARLGLIIRPQKLEET